MAEFVASLVPIFGNLVLITFFILVIVVIGSIIYCVVKEFSKH